MRRFGRAASRQMGEASLDPQGHIPKGTSLPPKLQAGWRAGRAGWVRQVPASLSLGRVDMADPGTCLSG